MRLILYADNYTLLLYFISLIGELEAAKDKAFTKAAIFIKNMLVMRLMYSLKFFGKRKGKTIKVSLLKASCK